MGETVTVRLGEVLTERAKAYALAEDRSVSWLVRKALESYLGNADQPLSEKERAAVASLAEPDPTSAERASANFGAVELSDEEKDRRYAERMKRR